MNEIQAIILGIVQGITEFLPISSSAHLNIFPELLNWPSSSLTFDIFIHFGTLLAVILYFRSDIISLLNIKRDKDYIEKRVFNYRHVFISTLLVAPLYLLTKIIGDSVHNFGMITIISLFILGIPMIFIDSIQKRLQSVNHNITYKQSVLIGFMQGFALINGISRSGITIMTGMISGLSKDTAKTYSFIISIPIILLAVLSSIFEIFNASDNTNYESVHIMLLGSISAFLSGYFAIRFFLNYLNSHSLAIFGYYRIILAIILLYIFYL